MFLVLMQNADPYCGGDYQFCENEEELKDCMRFNLVYNVYKFDTNKNQDLLDFYLKKFDNAYNNTHKNGYLT